jgi:N-acetylglutamate synthase-like GNAT family acetyltransferase
VIRELRDADVPAVVALINRLEPHWVMTEAAFRHGMATRPARLRYLRLVAEEHGEIVAWSAANLFAYAESPDSGAVSVNVREDRRRRGIGGALLERGLAHLEATGVSRVRAAAIEEEGRRFLEARGFRHAHSYRLSQLDPRDVDLSGLQELRERKAAEGFTVVPISACRAEDVHRVEEASMRDTPTDEPITHMPYDEWVALHWRSPLLTREGSFAVLHEGRPVALSMLHVDPQRRLAENAGTGTLRAFRRRGLARLAKLCQVQWSAASGITAVVTDNDETNAAMLAINGQLGYRPLAEVQSFVRELR